MLAFAVALLFMHNVIPHVHAEEHVSPGQNQETDEDRNLLDFLVDSLQLDFGDGHLECFSQAEGPSFSGISMICQNTPFPFGPSTHLRVTEFEPQEEVVPKARDEILFACIEDTGSPLRAPPIFA